MADYFDLGGCARPVTTAAAQAQTWFTRGLLWCYGFNHEEAVWCFEQAIAADPRCAMAHWGLAYALGPNYNKPWEAFDQVELSTSVSRAHTAATVAASLAGPATPAERGLVTALAARYPSATPATCGTCRPTWRCCAATTGGWSRPTAQRSRPTRNTARCAGR